MAVREILLFGDPRLYQRSEEIRANEIPSLSAVIRDLHDTLMDFRQKHGAGLAIAAPQIGVMKRLLYLYWDQPLVLINPVLQVESTETFMIWDYCLSAPELMVKVKRYLNIAVTFLNEYGEKRKLEFERDKAALVQHEYDHLNGILSVARAIDERSFGHRSLRDLLLKEY
ncbi:MAG TPA: peptide deformylase [Bacillota bacterium]